MKSVFAPIARCLIPLAFCAGFDAPAYADAQAGIAAAEGPGAHG